MPRRGRAAVPAASSHESLSGGFDNDDAAYFVQFSLRNACVTFNDEKNGRHHSMWISREGVTGIAHGFSEYVFGYQRISLVRAWGAHDAASWLSQAHFQVDAFQAQPQASLDPHAGLWSSPRLPGSCHMDTAWGRHCEGAMAPC